MEELKVIAILGVGAIVIGAILFFIGKLLFRNSIKNENNRKVTKQDTLEFLLVIPVLLILFWFIEKGNKWAAIILSVLMISAKIYANYVLKNNKNENN